jgi:hypothetical protein
MPAHPRWDKSYWQRVKQHARALRGDGCSGVPDVWGRPCCDEHDVAYRCHNDPDGQLITRAQADARFRRCLASRSPLRHLGLAFASPLAWLYWLGVRLFGRRAWRAAQAGKRAKVAPTPTVPPAEEPPQFV